MLAGEEIDGVRLLAAGIMVFFTLLALHHIIGTRPISELNAPPLILLVTLGIAVSAVKIWDSIAPLEGALAFGIPPILLWVVGLATRVGAGPGVGWSPGERLLIVPKGQVLPMAAEHARLPEEILGAVRRCGYASLDGLEVVTLEPDGCFTVMDNAGHVSPSSLSNVVRLPIARVRKDF